MSHENFLRMAREAGFQTGEIHGTSGRPVMPLVRPLGFGCMVELERFAALVRADAYAKGVAAEREVCAAVCERVAKTYQEADGMEWSELKLDAQTGALECASVIRSRGTA